MSFLDDRMKLTHVSVTRGSQLRHFARKPSREPFQRMALAHSFGLQQRTHFVTEYVHPRCTVATTVLRVPHAEIPHPVFTCFPRQRKEAFGNAVPKIQLILAVHRNTTVLSALP